jgi:type II secretory pathway component PulF
VKVASGAPLDLPPGKPAPVAPPRPLLAPWLAFVVAGACGVVAGELAASVPSWAATYAELEVELPLLTSWVVDLGRTIPAVLVLGAVAFLALGGVPVERRAWTGAVSAAVNVAAGLAALTAGALFLSTVLAYFALSKALQR